MGFSEVWKQGELSNYFWNLFGYIRNPLFRKDSGILVTSVWDWRSFYSDDIMILFKEPNVKYNGSLEEAELIQSGYSGH